MFTIFSWVYQFYGLHDGIIRVFPQRIFQDAPDNVVREFGGDASNVNLEHGFVCDCCFLLMRK
jgi:hypothetical protein